MTTKDEAEKARLTRGQVEANKAARARRRKMLGLPPEPVKVPYVDEIPSADADPEQTRRRAEKAAEAEADLKRKELAELERQKAERDRKDRERKEAEEFGKDPATARRRAMLKGNAR